MNKFNFALMAIVGTAAVAVGDILPMNGNGRIFEVQATRQSDGVAGSWGLMPDAGTWWTDADGNYVWTWEAPVGWTKDVLGGDGSVVTTLSSTEENRFKVEFVSDPIVNVSFNVTSGFGPTQFIISSGLLGFPLIPSPIAKASAGVSVTDSDGSGNGAFLVGAFGDGSTYKANYNGLVPGGVNFASFNLNTPVPVPFDTQTNNASLGFLPIGPAFNMSAGFNFILSAGDSASGTSTFVILVPSPAGFALLGLGGLVITRRRR